MSHYSWSGFSSSSCSNSSFTLLPNKPGNEFFSLANSDVSDELHKSRVLPHYPTLGYQIESQNRVTTKAQHSELILNGLRNLRENGVLCDVTLVAESNLPKLCCVRQSKIKYQCININLLGLLFCHNFSKYQNN